MVVLPHKGDKMNPKIVGLSEYLVEDYKTSGNTFIEKHFDNIVKDYQKFVDPFIDTLTQKSYDAGFVCFIDGCFNALDNTSEFRKGLML